MMKDIAAGTAREAAKIEDERNKERNTEYVKHRSDLHYGMETGIQKVRKR